MTQQRRTQAQRSEEMRTRLSRAAYEVIAERGHSAFRTAAVAARAGVSQGALLHHFETKDAVTLAAIEYALDVAGAASQTRLAHAPAADAVLKAMLEDFRAFFLGDRFWVALDITMDASKNAALAPKIRRLVAKRRQPVYGAWVAALTRCGWTQEKAADVVRMTAALVSGFAIRSLWAKESSRDESLDRRWFEFVQRD